MLHASRSVSCILTDYNKSQSSVSTRNLQDLPNELLLQIVELLELTPPPTDDLLISFVQSMHPLLFLRKSGRTPVMKTLRQVSKRLYLFTTPFLLYTFTLCEHPDSWATLNNIARSRIAPCIRVIDYNTTKYFPSLGQIEKWCTAITTEYNRLQGGQLTYQDSYGKCHSLVGFRRTQPTPHIALDLLPNLELLDLPPKVLWLISLDPKVLSISDPKRLLVSFTALKAMRPRMLDA